jgi:hypothetical protein
MAMKKSFNIEEDKPPGNTEGLGSGTLESNLRPNNKAFLPRSKRTRQPRVSKAANPPSPIKTVTTVSSLLKIVDEKNREVKAALTRSGNQVPT